MRLPYIQIEGDFLTAKAPMVAALAGIPLSQAIGCGVQLFAFAVTQTATKERAPDGVLLDPDAPAILETVLGWQGEPGKLFAAFVRSGLVEKLEVGARVRGLDRYRSTWEKAESDRLRKGAAKLSTGIPSEVARKSDRLPLEKTGQTQTQTQTQIEKQIEAKEEAKAEEQLPLAAAAALAPETVEQLQEAWNRLAPEPLPRWRETGKARRRQAQARLRDRTLPDWRAVIERIGRSSFCLGANDRGWVASPDWLLQPETAAKVLEGKYDDRQATGPPRPRDVSRGYVAAQTQDHGNVNGYLDEMGGPDATGTDD